VSQNDTLMRNLTLLRIIPRAPLRRDTNTLHEMLKEEGFNVDIRTLQRDLHKLSTKFPLMCQEEKTGPHRWQYVSDFVSDLPAMDTAEALALVMAEDSLAGKLPPSALAHVQRRFGRARQHLDALETNGLAHWRKRVSSIPEGKTLLPPEVAPGIWDAVSDALLNQRAIDVTYRSRSKKSLKQFTVHSQGIVVRGSISYVLATIDEYQDVRQLVLHRFQDIQQSEKLYRPAPDFSVQDYIEKGEFGYLIDQTPIQLIADINEDMAKKLAETPISRDQQLSALNLQKRAELRATVPNDKQTLSWIRSLGPAFCVKQPAKWRDELAADAERVLAFAKAAGYQSTTETAQP
tara:strand:+ start:844 stop:1887 length:1044 start_codon:yes stop_codon:yes gene_type:complete